MKITTDMIVGTGLILALLLAISLPIFGVAGNPELCTTLASGLVGYIGRAVVEHKDGEPHG